MLAQFFKKNTSLILLAAGAAFSCVHTQQTISAEEAPARSWQDERENFEEAVYRGNLDELRRIVALFPQAVHHSWGEESDVYPALHNAVMEGHLPIVQFLIIHGVEVKAQNRWGATPLH